MINLIKSFNRTSESSTGNVIRLAGGNAFAQALGIIVAPIITRLFAPEAYGTAALFSSIAAIIGVVVCMRYDLSIMLPKSDDEAANLVAVSIFFTFLVTAISSVLILFAGEKAVRLLKAPELGKYTWLIPIATLLSGTYLALNYWNSRTKHFGRISLSQIASSASSQIVRISAGFAGLVSSGALIGANLFGSLISLSILGGQLSQKDRMLFRHHIRWERMLKAIRRYKKFPLVETWGTLLNIISWQLPFFLLSPFFSPAVVGLFALGFAVIYTPMHIITGAVSQVFYQRICEAKHKSAHKELVAKLFKNLVTFGLFPILVLGIVGQDLFSVAFGKSWAEAGIYTQLLSPWLFFVFISSPLSMIFLALEKQGSLLIMNLLIFLSRLISLYIGGVLGNRYLAIGLFSAAGVLIYFIITIWILKISGNTMRSFFTIILVRLLVFLPFGGVLLFLKLSYNPHPLCILSVSFLMVTSYLLFISFKHFTKTRLLDQES